MSMARKLGFTITAVDRSRGAFNQVQNNLRKTQGLQRSWNAGLNSNRRAVQQFGFQMSDFAIQIAGGQSAMLAFTQQGGQMLQFFGPAGAISAAFLAVFGSLAIAFTRSGLALSELTPILGVLQEDFQAIGRTLKSLGSVFIDFANLVVNNMDRILVTVTMIAGFFAGRWVVGILAAKNATYILSGALIVGRAGLLGFAKALGGLRVALYAVVGGLNALRIMMVRVGFLALIVAAGELVYQFTRLVKAAGGFGNALGLLKDVAVEVFGRISDGFGYIPAAVKAGSAKMYSFFFTQITNMSIAFAKFTQDAARGMNQLFGTNLQGISVMTGFVGDMQDADIEIAASARSAAEEVEGAWASLTLPLDSIQAIRDAMAAADDEGKDIDVRDWFKGGGDDDEDGAGGAAAKAKKELTDMEKAFKDLASSIDGALSTAFSNIIDRSKSLKDIVNNMLQTVFNKMTELLMAPVFSKIAQSLTGSLFSSGFGGALGQMQSFAGGGDTGTGARSGGLDGKGGRLAMIHPQETITDHTKGMSGGSGDTHLAVHIHENASDGETQVKQSPGRVDVYLRKMVNDTIAGGSADKAMQQRFGMRPQPGGA